MSTLFTKIIDGELPGRFVWSDDRASASSRSTRSDRGTRWSCRAPRSTSGSTPTPRARAPDRGRARDRGRGAQHLVAAAGRLLVAGFEVPHLHLHVFPAWDMAAFDFANAATSVDEAEQDAHPERLRGVPCAGGHGDRCPGLTVAERGAGRRAGRASSRTSAVVGHRRPAAGPPGRIVVTVFGSGYQLRLRTTISSRSQWSWEWSPAAVAHGTCPFEERNFSRRSRCLSGRPNSTEAPAVVRECGRSRGCTGAGPDERPGRRRAVVARKWSSACR